MNDERLRALYAGAMARAPLDAEPVALEAMLDVIERRGSESERSRTLRAILRDPRAREEFELLRAVHRAGEEPRAGWKTSAMWRMAAGIVVMLGAFSFFALLHDPADTMRGGAATVSTLQPADGVELTSPPLFTWHAVENAADYRIEIVDSSGAVVFEETVRDTMSTGPVGTVLVQGQRYRWSVTAVTTDARSLRSPVSGFLLRAP